MPARVVRGGALQVGEVIRDYPITYQSPDGQIVKTGGSIGNGDDHPYVVVAISQSTITLRNCTSNAVSGLTLSKVTKAD